MKKSVLEQKTAQVKTDTKTALEALWTNINKGQRKQIIKLSEIRELFDRYGVDYSE